MYVLTRLKNKVSKQARKHFDKPDVIQRFMVSTNLKTFFFFLSDKIVFFCYQIFTKLLGLFHQHD